MSSSFIFTVTTPEGESHRYIHPDDEARRQPDGSVHIYKSWLEHNPRPGLAPRPPRPRTEHVATHGPGSIVDPAAAES